MPLVEHAVDSPLGRWRVAEWRPAPGDVLDGVVECAWHFQGDTTLPRERVFPDGRVEVVVQLDEPHALVDGTDVTRFPSVCVSGLRMAPMVIEAPPRGSRVLAVRLHPTGAHALLGMPLAETCGRTLALGDVLGRAAGELAQRCHAARSDVERLRIAVRWVAERVTRARGADPAVAWIAAEIARTHGTVPIGTLRERSGLSPARLVSAFRAQVGTSPKRFARIVRFRRALDLLHEGGRSVTDVALVAGYFAQPHLHGDFRELAGMTPGEFLAARRFARGVSVAEAEG